MPGPESTRPVIYRFGVFEFDIENREWRNQGTPVKLQDQPFRILAYLVQRPGALVSREELKRDLWPEGTFVDFEHSLNTAIKKVRQALGEDAGSTEISRRFRGTGTDGLHLSSLLTIIPSLSHCRYR